MARGRRRFLVTGTQTAGLAAAVGNNNTGVVGVAYSCKILPITGLNLTDSQRAAGAFAVELQEVRLMCDAR